MRRWGEPADIGRVALALASGDFHFSTGDAIDVDGGIHIHRL
jgi:NAD(P)-dependent dehydrogenase (short-subunit alcohol dehydrogenase family)